MESRKGSCDQQRKCMKKQSKRQHQTEIEIDHLEQLARRKRNQAEAEISQLEQLAKRKQNQLQQQAKKGHVIDQYMNNRSAECQRLQENHQVGLQVTDKSGFLLTNHQLSIQEAVKFLDAGDPQEHKWKDFEKSPVK